MYNEERGAEICVRRVCTALAAIPYPSQLIAVNDGSRDQTAAILDRLAPEFPNLLVVDHQKNAGYGAALRTGIERPRSKASITPSSWTATSPMTRPTSRNSSP